MYKRGPGRVFRDTGILTKNLKGIRDIFVNIERDTGYLDQFKGYKDTMFSEFWGYLPYLF